MSDVPICAYLFPGLGCGPWMYRDAQRRLSELAPTHVVNLPGYLDASPVDLIRDFALLTDHALRQIEQWSPDPGTAVGLFGFSMGALLACETAWYLEQAGRTVEFLVVAAAPAPHSLPAPTLDAATESDLDLFTYLASQGVMHEEVLGSPALVQRFAPVVRAELAALSSHPRGRRVLSCQVISVSGAQDPLLTPSNLAEWLSVGGPESRVVRVPGGHAAPMQESRHVLLLEAMLRRSKRRAHAS